MSRLVLREVKFSGPGSEDFQLRQKPPPPWGIVVRVGYLIACSGWAIAWALGVDHDSMALVAAMLVAGLLLHGLLHLISTRGLGPFDYWSVMSSQKLLMWTQTRRVGWVEHEEYFTAWADEVALSWSTQELTFFTPLGSSSLAFEGEAEELATRAARALHHAAPDQNAGGFTSRGAKAPPLVAQPLRRRSLLVDSDA